MKKVFLGGNMSWEFVSRELRELLDVCDEQEAFLVSFDLMKDVPVAHMNKNCGYTDIYIFGMGF